MYSKIKNTDGWVRWYMTVISANIGGRLAWGKSGRLYLKNT
jgi:hypothetical protein